MTSHSSILYTLDTLQSPLQSWRDQGKSIVFTNGCFDILHQGHIHYLTGAKKHGDILLIGLNSDASVKQLKGPQRPINNEEARTTVIGALGVVDGVIIFNETICYITI